MLRAVLMGTLAVSAVAACKSKDDVPKAEPGAVAGKVVELSGDVKIGAKPLAVGDPVKADDTIETGADASVVIVLAHNNARWSVGPNRKVKASESAAWTAEKGAGGSTEQTSSAAGRQAERTAADTAASAQQRGPEVTPAPGGPQGAVAAPSSGGEGGGAGERNDTPPRTTAKAAIAPAEKPKVEAAVRGGDGDKGAAPPPPPAVQPTLTERAPQKPEVRLTDSDIPGALQHCIKLGATVKLSVHIAAHVPTIKFLSTVDQATKSCLTKAASQMRLDIESGDIKSLEITR